MGSLRKKGKKWYGRWYDERGRPHERAFVESRRESEQMLRDAESEVERARVTGRRRRNLTEIRIRDLTPPYLADLKARVAPRTYSHAKAHLEDVLRRLQVSFLDEVSARELLRVRAEIVAQGLSHRVANMRIDRFLTMLRWTEKIEELGLTIPKLDRLPETGSHARRKRRRLRPQEVNRLLRAADEVDEELGGYPIAPFFETMLRTGFRFSEAASLTWSDFEAAEDCFWLTVRPENEKEDQPKRNPVPLELGHRLERLRLLQVEKRGDDPDPGDRIFLTARWTPIDYGRSNAQLQRRLNRVIEAAKLKKKDHTGRTIDFHALRHTFATALVEGGVPMEISAELMGHKDIETTRKIYAEMGRVDRKVALDALNRLWKSRP